MALKLKQKQGQKQEQKQDLGQQIDTAYLLDVEIKEKKKALDKSKGKIKAEAMREGAKTLSGDIAEVVFSDETQTNIDPKDLFTLMVDLDMQDEFFKLVKVNITDAKEKLGELSLDEIASRNVKEYARMSFKKRG